MYLLLDHFFSGQCHLNSEKNEEYAIFLDHTSLLPTCQMFRKHQISSNLYLYQSNLCPVSANFYPSCSNQFSSLNLYLVLTLQSSSVSFFDYLKIFSFFIVWHHILSYSMIVCLLNDLEHQTLFPLVDQANLRFL